MRFNICIPKCPNEVEIHVFTTSVSWPLPLFGGLFYFISLETEKITIKCKNEPPKMSILIKNQNTSDVWCLFKSRLDWRLVKSISHVQRKNLVTTWSIARHAVLCLRPHPKVVIFTLWVRLSGNSRNRPLLNRDMGQWKIVIMVKRNNA